MTDFQTSDRDVSRAIRSWLHEERHEDASRLAGAVLDQAEATPRRRASWWPARRIGTVNKTVGFGLGAAAVIVALVVGAQLLGSPSAGGFGAPPSPEASATAEPSPTPEPSAAQSAPAAGSLPEGSHILSDGKALEGLPTLPITVTIPAPGWHGEAGGGILTKNDSPDAPDGAGMIVFFGDLYVYEDPCEWSTTRPDTPATTVDELVAALAAQASRDASEPVDITVDGYAGKAITLHVPDDAVFWQCDQATFGSWGVPGGDPAPYRYNQDPGQIDEIWIVDLDGVLATIDWTYYAGTPTEHVEELRAIVESITFEEP